jgi:hypothetical protein
MEYTDIPEVFFMPLYKWWYQKVVSLITTAKRNFGFISLLLKK